MVVSLKPFKVRALETVRVGNACTHHSFCALIPPPLSCLSFISLCVPSPSPCVICPDGRCVGSVSCERPSLIQGAARVACKRSRWSICLGPPPSMTCKSLLISVQGIEVLDLIFLAAKKKKKKPLVKNFLCVCVRVCVRECCSVFPSCLSNRKLMLGSTEDREEAFSFLCESFETERKK